jgi:excisionase family DNA binding protein
MSQSEVLLTPEEVADSLRIPPADVLRLLEEGRLAGLQVAGHLRVRAESVNDFLREGLQRQNLRAIERALHDPARWAKVLREFPDVATSVEQSAQSPNSFAAFLNNALRHHGAEEVLPTMGTIILYHGTGAEDFEIVGPAWEPSEEKRVLFNARRLLIARGQADAVALFDSAPFGVFPAMNHFNDEFHVLHAELPLLDYEDVRLTQADKRQAARQLAEAIAESTGPYIRFVAIRLQIANPEEWDVFVCHASEDKAGVARPLYDHLTRRGISCWIDEAEIAWGESIVAKIQQGLSRARYVIVVLSPQLLQKKWAQKELRSALSLEIEAARNVVLPLIVGDAHSALASLPFLQEKRYVTWNGDPSSVERELRILARKAGASA